MNALGVWIQDNLIKIAHITKKNKGITINSLKTLPNVSSIIETLKNTPCISALDSEKLVRKTLQVKLKKISSILKILPFQLEGLLPFPPENALVYPFFYFQEQGTKVIIFATTNFLLQQHIEEMRSKGIDPKQVSCTPCALANFAKWLFPEKTHLIFRYEKTAIVLEHEQISFAQTIEDPQKLDFFLDQKFDSYFKISWHQSISREKEPSHQLYEYAIPIGLALENFKEKNCQFRQDYFAHPTEKAQQIFFFFFCAVYYVLLLMTTGLSGWYLLSIKENFLKTRLETYLPSKKEISLENQIVELEKKISANTDKIPLFPDIPSAGQVLAWLSNFKEDVRITHINYQLDTYPKINSKNQPYAAKLDLEFETKSSDIAAQFRNTLETSPSLIDKKQKILWTNPRPNYYTISFWLKKM